MMKYIYLNLKRFDIPPAFGGINRLAQIEKWGAYIISSTQCQLAAIPCDRTSFVMFMPEAHIISAAAAKTKDSLIQLGSQGVHREDTAVGGNFGAFTTFRPASSVKALGCSQTLIGHSEERQDLADILGECGSDDPMIINRLLNKEIKAATAAGLNVLYCIGEKASELTCWQHVLRLQIQIGLDGVPKDQVVLAYEPVWAIGPGKIPPDRDTIAKVARYIKAESDGMPLVYGGGLKVENAGMLAGIPEIDGGLIALTRFSGEIGFYPKEYIDIVRTYLS